MIKTSLFISFCLVFSLSLIAQQKKDTISTFNLERCFNKTLSEKEREQYKNAIHQYSQQIKEHPKKAILYVNRGVAYASLGLFPDAITDYNKALNIDSIIPNAYYNRGIAKARFAYTKNACIDLKRAADLGLDLAIPLYNSKCQKYSKEIGEIKKK